MHCLSPRLKPLPSDPDEAAAKKAVLDVYYGIVQVRVEVIDLVTALLLHSTAKRNQRVDALESLGEFVDMCIRHPGDKWHFQNVLVLVMPCCRLWVYNTQTDVIHWLKDIITSLKPFDHTEYPIVYTRISVSHDEQTRHLVSINQKLYPGRACRLATLPPSYQDPAIPAYKDPNAFVC